MTAATRAAVAVHNPPDGPKLVLVGNIQNAEGVHGPIAVLDLDRKKVTVIPGLTGKGLSVALVRMSLEHKGVIATTTDGVYRINPNEGTATDLRCGGTGAIAPYVSSFVISSPGLAHGYWFQESDVPRWIPVTRGPDSRLVFGVSKWNRDFGMALIGRELTDGRHFITLGDGEEWCPGADADHPPLLAVGNDFVVVTALLRTAGDTFGTYYFRPGQPLKRCLGYLRWHTDEGIVFDEADIPQGMQERCLATLDYGRRSLVLVGGTDGERGKLAVCDQQRMTVLGTLPECRSVHAIATLDRTMYVVLSVGSNSATEEVHWTQSI